MLGRRLPDMDDRQPITVPGPHLLRARAERRPTGSLLTNGQELAHRPPPLTWSDAARLAAPPSYSPDYNPIEFLWRATKRSATHNRYFPEFSDLVASVEDAVAAPLSDQRDQTFLTVDRRPLAVFPWIEGEHRPRGALSDDECHAIGALLGRAHRALAESTSSEQQTYMLPPVRSERTLDRAAELRRLVQTRQLRDPFDVLAEECLDFTVDQVQRARGEIGAQPCVTTWQWTHGDFHPGNVVCQPDGTMTLVDWDKARVQPRLFELVRSIVLWLADAETGTIDVRAAWSMMRGYAARVHVDSSPSST